MKVVILAGGLGTRLSEYTNLIPKPMVQINKKPIIYYIMKHFSNYGHKEFYVALGYKGNVIKDYFKGLGLDINQINFAKENPKYTNNLPKSKSLKDIVDLEIEKKLKPDLDLNLLKVAKITKNIRPKYFSSTKKDGSCSC